MFADKQAGPGRVLFVFAHMDDEAVSSYGTIRRMLDECVEVTVACMCGLGRGEASAEKREARRKIFASYSEKGAGVYYGEKCDLCLDRISAQSTFDTLLEIHRPDVVVTHWPHDLHFEHRLVGEVALVACRNVPGKPVRQLWYTSSPAAKWTYGQLGRSFTPNFFVDIGKYEQDKLEMLRKYSECGELPANPLDLRSLESVMQYDISNGLVAGVQAAESYVKAFEVV